MKFESILNEISGLPNLLYGFSENDESPSFHLFIMGGQQGQPVETISHISTRFLDYLFEMIEISKMNLLSENDKDRIVKLYKKIKTYCNYSVAGFTTRDEQFRLLRKLDEKQLCEIEEEIDAYKLARSLFLEHSTQG